MTIYRTTHYIEADLHDPDRILELATQFLDFAQPIALTLMGILGHIPDDDQALSIVQQLVAGLASGSYLVLEDGTSTDQSFLQAQQGYDDTRAVPYRLRSPNQIARFFEGLDLLDPGVVPLPLWRPDPGQLPTPAHAYGAVARIP